jgi:hypothetical protein
MKFLSESLTPVSAALMEMKQGQDLYLSGIMMQAELVNGNGRKYPLAEISKAVETAQKRIAEGHYILGELNHPDNLSIDLKNVSHIITEAWMDGNYALGKCKILNSIIFEILYLYISSYF